MRLRLLIKRAFRSLFKNPFFAVLMTLLVLLSSATYTVFESTTSSFTRSYNELTSDTKAHEAYVNENFKLSDADEVDTNFVLASTGPATLTEDSLRANAVKQLSGKYVVTLVTAQSYASYFPTHPQQAFEFELRADNWAEALTKVQQSALVFKQTIESNLKARLATTFVSNLNQLYPGELTAQRFESLLVNQDVKAFKVVNYAADAQLNLVHVYDGTSAFWPAWTRTEFEAALTTAAAELWPTSTISNLDINANKGYRWTATQKGGLGGAVVGVTDPSAFLAVVSPAYAKANNVTTMSLSEIQALVNGGWKKIFPNALTSGMTFADAMNANSFVRLLGNSVVQVASTPYIAIGIGVSPDFAYPVIDVSSPAVNTATQAVVYVPMQGYARIRDAFQSNQQETFISLRFGESIAPARRAEILSEIEAICQTPGGTVRNGLIFSENSFGPTTQMTHDLSVAPDALPAIRISFLETLRSTINTVSIVTTTMLVLFVATIVVLVFNVLLRTNRRSLATLLALGYSRLEIATATAVISFLLGALPAVIGYFTGFGLQFVLTSQFVDFWTLPTANVAVSWISLVITVGLPTVMIFLLILVATLWTLLPPIRTMLDDRVLLGSGVTEYLIRPLRGLSIRTKYVLALTFRNVGKLVLVGLASLTSAIALMVSFSTLGKADQAYEATLNLTSYEYKFDLITPTVEGGPYARVRYAETPTGYQFLDHSNNEVSFQETYGATTPASARLSPHWHVPGLGEVNYATTQAVSGVVTNQQISNATTAQEIKNYLRYKLQFKPLIDKTLIANLNPWEIARQLMPDNQQNLSNQSARDLSNSYRALIAKGNLNVSDPNDLIKGLLTQRVPLRDDNLNLKGGLYSPYIISYDTLITNDSDEEYTYLDADTSLGDKIINYHIQGVTPETKMYRLNDYERSLLKAPLTNGNVPVFTNKYLAARYGLSVGSTLPATLNNHVERNFVNFTKPKITLEVVGVLDSYNNLGFITSQSAANNLIGLKSGEFNGIFSSTPDSVLAQTLPLYSPSGFYLPTDTINPGSAYESFLAASLQNAAFWPHRDTIAATPSAFVAKYSNTLLAPIFQQVGWKQIDQQTFNSVSQLSSSLINAIQVVSITLSVLFTLIVTSLIIRSNRRRIATLWALGYRRREVIIIFSAQFLLSLVLSLGVAVPVSFVVLELMRGFVIDFGQILIPFALAPWAPVVMAALLVFLFLAATSYTIATMPPSTALRAFKAE